MSGVILLFFRMILTLVLYLFLFWITITIWKDLKIQSQVLSFRKVSPIKLFICSTDNKVESFTIAKPKIILGRSPACEIRINDHSISNQHLLFSHHHNQWWVEDLGSTNGSALNGNRLTIPTVLITNDEIVCGKTTVTVSIIRDKTTTKTKHLDE